MKRPTQYNPDDICQANNDAVQKHAWTKVDEKTGRAKCALCDAVETE